MTGPSWLQIAVIIVVLAGVVAMSIMDFIKKYIGHKEE